MPVDPALFSRLEAMGEEAVRKNVALGLAGTKGSEHNDAVLAWLKSKDDARVDDRASRSLSISEEALSIAKEANRIAKEDLASARSSAAAAWEQARWARWAAIIAMIAALIAAKDQILILMLGTS